jgi:hypothetical protein
VEDDLHGSGAIVQRDTRAQARPDRRGLDAGNLGALVGEIEQYDARARIRLAVGIECLDRQRRGNTDEGVGRGPGQAERRSRGRRQRGRNAIFRRSSERVERHPSVARREVCTARLRGRNWNAGHSQEHDEDTDEQTLPTTGLMHEADSCVT